MSVPGAVPTVARNLVSAPDAARRQDDGARFKEFESAAFPFIGEDAGDSVTVFEQGHDGVLHVDIDPLVNPVILKRPDHLQAGAIADVGKPGIFVTAEIALKDSSVVSPVEHGAPGFELMHAIGSFPGVQLRHPPVVDILPAPHRIREVDLPIVPVVDMREGCGNTALRHDGVSLAEQTFADHADGHAGGRGFDRRAQPCPTGADH